MSKEADANQRIGRESVRQALHGLGELEETFSRHKRVTNQQGRALESLANVITAMRQDAAEMQARIAVLEMPWYRRLWFRGLLVVETRRRAQAAKRPRLTITRLPDDPTAPVEDEAPETPAGRVDRLEAEYAAKAAAPVLDHVHQYAQESPFLFRCSVCDKRSTLEEIASEAEYLSKLKADSAAGAVPAGDQTKATA